MKFPDLLERFIYYAMIDTGSDENSKTFPSTEGQAVLAERLKAELVEIGLSDACINEHGYVLASLSSTNAGPTPAIALIAHLDTSPDVSGHGVTPQVHRDYDGEDISLSMDPEIILAADNNPPLKDKIGNTIITTDGTTLLGADDKAGIAEIMSAVKYLISHPEIPRPHIRVIFTPDEEIGKSSDMITTQEIGADFGYTIDGGDAGEIEDETFCADTVKIIVKGVNVHPGYAKDRIANAVKIASEIIENLPKGYLSPETTEDREGYIHPHHISGTVERAEIKMLIRDFTEQGLMEKEDFISSLVHDARRRHPLSDIVFEIERSYRNMKQVLESHPEVVEIAEEAIARSGLTSARTAVRGGTDGARLCFMGLPTPNIFTGGHNFHSRYEWISLEDMEKAAEVIVRLMELWASKAPVR
ncbi:MAG: peptidase T [Deltaproteobacteria bacterium]|nr:peptidase T [Deltaproteobacteria bacterium]